MLPFISAQNVHALAFTDVWAGTINLQSLPVPTSINLNLNLSLSSAIRSSLNFNPQSRSINPYSNCDF